MQRYTFMVSLMVDIDDAWRGRLEQALETNKRSARSVSLAMGRGPGYIYSVLRTPNKPGLENLIAICDELQISILWLLFGVDMNKESEELLRIFSTLDKDQRQQFLTLARSLGALAPRQSQ